jgi:hypothetical protein
MESDLHIMKYWRDIQCVWTAGNMHSGGALPESSTWHPTVLGFCLALVHATCQCDGRKGVAAGLGAWQGRGLFNGATIPRDRENLFSESANKEETSGMEMS